MAHGHHDAVLSWEWDSVLLLSNPYPLASPSLEAADDSNSSGLREPLGSVPVSSSDHHRHHHHDSLHSNETSADHMHTDSRSSETRDKGSSRDKNRDPRLDCPNFLAGKVPCACTENDDDDSGVSRKRSKPAPRCQVAACGAELTDLKGYHQRHRVCLRCAHATRVVLRGQPHRYCQQCGKFHPICDFDEGKRSCRRKLEKHNNRRRRKAGEDFLPSLDYGDTDTQNESSPGDGSKIDVLSEAELKESFGEKPSLDAEETHQTPRITMSEKLNGVAKVSETSHVPEDGCANIPLHTLEPSTAAFKENVPTPESAANGTLETDQEKACSGEQVPFTVEPHQDNIRSIYPDNFSLHSSPHPEAEGATQIRRGNDEESLLALLMEENGETEHSRFSENTAEHLITNQAQLWESSTSPRRLSKEVAYSSLLPTGRISFKLYDWNPGDFPRHLRQQVMEWLSNMPVDLEGYIRSGCTILTIFIAMPQTGWDELNADWAGAVLKLVKAEQSLFKFWSSGYLTARMDNHVVHINNGEVAHPLSKRICEPPSLNRVRPLCLEAGCEEEVVILGRNFQQPQSRLLVSFDGKYVVNDAYQSRLQGASKGAVTRVQSAGNIEDARLFVSIPALPSKSSGTAYVEVEHMSGTSNFIPVLVAEKNIVDEVRSLEYEMDMPTTCCRPNIDGSAGFPYLSQRRAHSLLLDLGWVLRGASLETFKLDFQLEILELHIERLRRLLFFGVKRSWCNVVERVLQLANRAGLMEKIGVLENGLSAVHVAVLHHKVIMVEHLISCAESLCASSSHCKFWWNLGFPGPSGLTTLHLVALQAGCKGLRDTLLKRKGGASMWNCVQDNLGHTPHDYSPLPFRCKVNALTLHTPEGTTKTEDFSLISHELPKVQCEDVASSELKGEARLLLPSLPYRDLWKVTPRTIVGVTHHRLPVPIGNFDYEGLTMYISRGRKRNNQLLQSVSIVLVYAGLCVMLQGPNEVILVSLSSLRSLWSLENGSQRSTM